MKNTTLTLLFLVIAMGLQAQVGIPDCGINFDYDNAGNRIKRYLCFQTSGLTQGDQETLDREGWREEEGDIEDLSNLVVFPNPTSGEVQIQTAGIDEYAKVFFLDASGRIIKEGYLGEGLFNIREFSEGSYFLIVRSREKQYQTKIIKTIR